MNEKLVNILTNKLNEEKLLLKERLIFVPDELHEIGVVVISYVAQLYSCYTTVPDPKHTMALVLRLLAVVASYFEKNGENVGFRSRPLVNEAEGLILLRKFANQVENALGRGAKGDARSALMELFIVCFSMLILFGELDEVHR